MFGGSCPYEREAGQDWMALHNYHAQLSLEADLGAIILKHSLVCNYQSYTPHDPNFQAVRLFS